MWPFKPKQYEELMLQISGWEKVRVPIENQCRHRYSLSCENSLMDFAYCDCCGLRTPSVPHSNYSWAGEIFRNAKDNGKLFRDPLNLQKIYILNRETNTIEPTLCYVYGESKRRKKQKRLD